MMILYLTKVPSYASAQTLKSIVIFLSPLRATSSEKSLVPRTSRSSHYPAFLPTPLESISGSGNLPRAVTKLALSGSSAIVWWSKLSSFLHNLESSHSKAYRSSDYIERLLSLSGRRELPNGPVSREVYCRGTDS